MIFISERIKNISVLESYIKDARLYFSIMQDELKKATPSKETIDSAAYVVRNSLKMAEDFEFCLEQRKCEITTSCDNPRFEESHKDEDNDD